MTNMRAFRHKITGKTAMFPETDYYVNHPHMEMVEDAGCEDCPKVVPNTEVLTVVPGPDPEKKNKKKKETKDE